MRNVVFVAPFPMDATLRFARGISSLQQVRLLGVLQQAPHPDVNPFDDMELVGDALDPAEIAEACENLAEKWGSLHRVTGILEPLQVPLAEVRDQLGIDGPDAATARRFRDKALMKDTLRAAGIPCARHQLCTEPGQAGALVAKLGLPVVCKPPEGAGCRSTWRLDTLEDLERALAELRPSEETPLLVEEFLQGDEGSCEMVVLGGKVVAKSVSRYLPGPLEVLRNPWMQWVCWLPRHLPSAEYGDLFDLGPQVVEVLGLRDGIAHMEWFRRGDGSLAVGEVAARPPGGQLSLMTGHVHGVDIYRTWAKAVVDGEFDGPWLRQASAGTAFLRGQGRGRVASVEGLHEVYRAVGDMVIEARLPQIGQGKNDSYEGEGYIAIEDEDEARVLAGLRTIVETVRIRYA
ncbi:MAG: ATP-grasp domain-containing protein [Deltaproteobacteria bacterium]|nr:ATP-grasp domain-containing protein [Deltaproteobacteria bacterium]